MHMHIKIKSQSKYAYAGWKKNTNFLSSLMKLEKVHVLLLVW